MFFAALPPSPTNLLLNTAVTNIATVQWSPPSTEVSVTSYSITISPAPGTGTCSGGTCFVSTQNCPISSPSCSFAITDVQYGQLYTITVQSMNCRGSSSPIVVQFTLQNPPTTGMHVFHTNLPAHDEEVSYKPLLQLHNYNTVPTKASNSWANFFLSNSFEFIVTTRYCST